MASAQEPGRPSLKLLTLPWGYLPTLQHRVFLAFSFYFFTFYYLIFLLYLYCMYYYCAFEAKGYLSINSLRCYFLSLTIEQFLLSLF